MVRRHKALQAIQTDEGLTVPEVGKLLNNLAHMEVRGQEDVIDLRGVNRKFVVAQLQAAMEGNLSPPLLFCRAQASPCF